MATKELVKPNINVKRDETSPEAIEIIAQSIIDVSEGFARIQKAKLKRKAVVLLLQDAIGPTNITRKQIELVLEYAPQLKDIYLNKF